LNEPLRVAPRSGRRASVCGAHRGSVAARALEAWLAMRADVVDFHQRRNTGVFDICYDDRGAPPGRFLRTLRDKVFAIDTSRPKRGAFDVRRVHRLRGRVRLRVMGLDEDQLATLTMLIAGLPGVKHTRHVPGGTTLLVVYDPDEVSEARVVEALRKSDPAEWDREWHRPGPIRWFGAISCTSVLVVCIARAAPFRLLALGIALNTLSPLRRSVTSLRSGKVSIDLLDVVATFAALATRRPATAAFVIWMVGVGDLLIDLSANTARSAMSLVMRHGEQKATRLLRPGGRLAQSGVEDVLVRDLNVGDRFVANTGQSIGADGVVVSGLAEVDEKALTGESRLLSKRRGARVFASSVVVEGRLVVEVLRSGKNTEAAKVERILNTVGSKPLTLQRSALDFAGKLVLPTIAVAGLAAALSSDVTRAVCILITDFGTGIRVATPTSAMAALAIAAREGVLIKGAQYLERLSKTDVIVFDKTGTLTKGTPEVVEIVTARGVAASTLISWSASAEARYDHPVARALKACAKEMDIRLTEPEPGSEEYAVGLGVSARLEGRRLRVGRPEWMKSQGIDVGRTFARHLARFRKASQSTLCVAEGERVVGIVAYSDGTRPEGAAIIGALREGGRRRVVLLSGDSPDVVETVARAVGIDEAVGGLLPEEKAAYVRELREAGNVVAMVGDGINDAPALALADVGISIHGSTDVALETADVILLGGGLSRLERAFGISDRAMTNVQETLGVVILPNAIAIALGALGLITPPTAAIINNGATIAAVLVGVAPLVSSTRGSGARACDGCVARLLVPRIAAGDGHPLRASRERGARLVVRKADRGHRPAWERQG
jgi:Cu2+-exporting ATPase